MTEKNAVHIGNELLWVTLRSTFMTIGCGYVFSIIMLAFKLYKIICIILRLKKCALRINLFVSPDFSKRLCAGLGMNVFVHNWVEL
uniref:Uncharacterized protein n=1 Tax=Anguilla anguilla TaxID=7936 RepID=A0A0E9X1Y4_ANGAN